MPYVEKCPQCKLDVFQRSEVLLRDGVVLTEMQKTYNWKVEKVMGTDTIPWPVRPNDVRRRGEIPADLTVAKRDMCGACGFIFDEHPLYASAKREVDGLFWRASKQQDDHLPRDDQRAAAMRAILIDLMMRVMELEGQRIPGNPPDLTPRA